MNGPKEKGRAQSRPLSDNQPLKASHAACPTSLPDSGASLSVCSRRPLPQELHADLGIIDDASAVGADA